MQTPYSDYRKTKGLIYFARMLDKIRLNAEGRLPPGYFVGVDDDPTALMRAVHAFWELIMMSWSTEPLREDRMRKFSIGVSNTAENLVKKKFLFGTRLFPSAAGGTKPATICKRPRNEMVGKIAMIFKPGSIYMTPKRAGFEIVVSHPIPVLDQTLPRL